MQSIAAETPHYIWLQSIQTFEDKNSIYLTCNRSSNVDVVRHLLTSYSHSQGANTNTPNIDGATALHMCAKFANQEVLEYLIEGGADPDSRDHFGRSPIMYALQNLSIRSLSLVYILFDEISDMNCAMKLMELGCEVDALDEEGRTLLHLAALHNCPGFARSLLARPSSAEDYFAFSPFLLDPAGNTPLHTAASAGALEVARLLLQYVKGETLATTEGKRENGVHEKCLALLRTKNVLGRTALHIASSCGYDDVTEYLISEV